VWKQSNPYRPGSTLTNGTTTHTFDAIGRVTSTVQPDGSAGSTSYAGNCATAFDEAGKIRKSCSDGLGRLIEVDEPGTGVTSGTPSTGTVTIGGYEGVNQYDSCPTNPYYRCWVNVFDSGYVAVTIDGYPVTASYGQGDTPQTITANLVGALNQNGSLVTASAVGNVITVTSRITGAGSKFSLSAGAHSTYTQYFTQSTFTATPGASSLTGGTDGQIGANPLVTLYSYDTLNNLTCAVQKATDTTAFSTICSAVVSFGSRQATCTTPSV